MTRRLPAYLVPVCIALLMAGEQPWKDKRVAQWSEDDAKLVLSNSPWAKTVTATLDKPSGGARSSRGGINVGGIPVGRGGSRMGGRGGRMEEPAGPQESPDGPLPTLTVRWESALPVQEAQLRIHSVNAPAMDEAHYAIVVLGLPSRMLNGDPQETADRLKPQAELKCNGKKSIRSSEARILPRDDGPILVFLFPRSQEISPRDAQVEFEAHIGRLRLTQVFELNEMLYAGKLEL
jgi:hypothetical protein